MKPAHLHLAEPSAPEAALSGTLAELPMLDLHGLRVAWRKQFRQHPPPHLSRSLLMRLLAYRIQARALGDLDRETARTLDRIAKQRRAGARNLVPPVPEPSRGRLQVGTVLVREHAGHLHRVTVVVDGFEWRGATYTSLSEIARAITGTRWNGPRFFGLRDRAKASSEETER